MDRLLKIANLLFLALVACVFIAGGGAEPPLRLGLLVVIIYIAYLARHAYAKDVTVSRSADDVVTGVYIVLLSWHLSTAQFHLLDKMLFPTPEAVLTLLISEFPEMLKNLGSSFVLLAWGYALAIITAIPIGLLVGWRKRLFYAVNPFTKVLGPIPPIVYIPYAIAILPTFKASSIFVIFIGSFWPIFINTVNGVFNIEKGLIDSARVLQLKESTMLWRIALPGAMPSIMVGVTLALVFSFILLTAAELIGATSGLGWYVKNYADFADYPHVIVGILFIGLVVTVLTGALERLQKRLLRWR